jgi:hypothetical protein
VAAASIGAWNIAAHGPAPTSPTLVIARHASRRAGAGMRGQDEVDS